MFRLPAAALLLSALLAPPAGAAPSISITPGPGPAGGYVPLSSLGGTALPMGDEDFLQFVTPAYTWAGQTWTGLGVSSNGYVVVGDVGSSSLPNQNLPDPAGPNNVLAPYWADLDPGISGAGDIYIGTVTDGIDTWLVVDWEAVVHFGLPGTPQTFEVWIRLHGGAGGDAEQVTFSYGLVTFIRPTTVGAEDASGTVGSSYYYNGAGTIVPGRTELRVVSDGLPIAVAVPAPSALAILALPLLGLGLPRRKQRA